MRHICQKLGFIFRRQRKLAGLFLQRLARLFHFLVLALHLLILVGKQAGFFLKFLVGLLQLLLAALQFVRQRLGLRQQIFRARIGLDGIDHNTDTFHELLEECLVGIAESFERSEFDDALDLAFKNDRQRQDIARRAVTQARRNTYVTFRNVGKQDLVFFNGALAHQAFTDIQPLAMGAAAFRRIART